MKPFLLSSLLLILLADNAAAQTPAPFCPKMESGEWCLLLHSGSTFTGEQSEFIVVRTWRDYQTLYGHLVPVEPPLRPEDQPPRPEDDLRLLKRPQWINGQSVVFAVALRRNLEKPFQFRLGIPKLEDNGKKLSVPVKVITPGDSSGTYQPAVRKGGAFWIVATTPAFLKSLGVTSLQNIDTFVVTMNDGEQEQVLYPISQYIHP